MLIVKKAVKAYALECAKDRFHKFTRVHKDFYTDLDAKIRRDIRAHVHALPSKGRSIK